MCGINGIFSYNEGYSINLDELQRTRDYMRARGPDGKGEWIAKHQRIGFGHRRLAIIELSELGAQPMSIDDDQFVITFNGEIYNHSELRAELKRNGVTFRGHSDTEVLIRLYKQHGIQMLEKLQGMFAFALWDESKQKLILARDPYGIKPLYYHMENGVFRFASEVKALLSGAGFEQQIASEGVIAFLLWGSVPEPLTLYKNIEQLPSGHFLEISRSGHLHVKNYWNLADQLAVSYDKARSTTSEQAMNLAKESIRDCVKAHMVSDVPVGVFLSAGLDSATISGLANRYSQATVQAITLGFKEFQGRSLDETYHASLIAKELNLLHKIITISLADVEKELPLFIKAMDQPTIDGLNTWLVSKAASDSGLKVVLSGLGGDELFGGYSTFNDIPKILSQGKNLFNNNYFSVVSFYIHKFLSKHVTSLDPNRSAFNEMARTPNGAYQYLRGLFMPWQLNEILDSDFLNEGMRNYTEKMNSIAHENNELPLKAKIISLESTHYMKNQLLRDTDWIGMSHSLEIRVPLVDRILTEQLGGFSSRELLGPGKSILPNSLGNKLPESVLNRPKTGFTVPIWRWLNQSEIFSDWKKSKVLQKANINSNKRWAYHLLYQMTEVSDYLK